MFTSHEEPYSCVAARFLYRFKRFFRLANFTPVQMFFFFSEELLIKRFFAGL